MLLEIKGLVIRTVDLSENDRLLILFTEEYGKVAAVARGSRALKSRYLAATQTFCYADFILYRNGDRYWVREATLIESFFDLRCDLSRMALASYICDVADDVVEENSPEKELLRLTLNALYVLAAGTYATETVRAVFEMRAAAVLGFMPAVDACETCGKADAPCYYLDVMNGTVQCAECYETARATAPYVYEEGHARIICPLSSGARAVMLYVMQCPIERIFAFRASDEEMREFGKTAETYLLNHLERTFQTLAFYKETLD